MAIVFMFPGQSSRYPEMLDRIVEAWGPAKDVVGAASELLGRDLAAKFKEPDPFATNRDVQVGVFLVAYLHLRALEARGVTAERSLGLSLGEYIHLVHIGALRFEEALRLVDARGATYDQGPVGCMASVFPVDIDDLTALFDKVPGRVEVANLNSPTQHVVAGEAAAIEALAQLVDSELGAEAVIIERRVPMHTSLFEPVATLLRPHLEAAAWQAPRLPYVSNVLGDVLTAPKPADFIDLLARHVYSPVRWRGSIELIADADPSAVFVEVGPKTVLSNLLQKRWRNVKKLRTDGADPLGASLDNVAAKLLAPAEAS